LTSYIIFSGTVAMRIVVSSGVSERMPDFFAATSGASVTMPPRWEA
jgi:hypothetical protein